jgi:putative DNA primase/helicase
MGTQHVPLRDVARGHWREILPAFGIGTPYLTGKHGPCPFCGGSDRYRWDDKDGTGSFICASCGAGDGIALAMRKSGLEFKDVADKIKAMLPELPAASTRQATPNAADLRQRMISTWKEAVPCLYGDPVSAYLEGRGIDGVPDGEVLRFARALRYQGSTSEPSRYLPAMIAKVTGPDGKGVNVHRTFLDPHGAGKAPVENPRRMMPGKVPPGSAIRLAPVTAGELGVAEGIETALSARKLFSVPCWAVVNTSTMMAWEPPAGIEIRTLHIFGDNDPLYGGQSAAYALAYRIAAQRKKYGIEVVVHIPEETGTDWNDRLKNVTPRGM